MKCAPRNEPPTLNLFWLLLTEMKQTIENKRKQVNRTKGNTKVQQILVCSIALLFSKTKYKICVVVLCCCSFVCLVSFPKRCWHLGAPTSENEQKHLHRNDENSRPTDKFTITSKCERPSENAQVQTLFGDQKSKQNVNTTMQHKQYHQQATNQHQPAP